MLTNIQQQKVTFLVDNAIKQALTWIDYATNNYANAAALSNDPEGMDSIINCYRAKDMALIFLENNPNGKLNNKLSDFDYDTVETFLQNQDPISIFNFFNQDVCLKNYILTNELDMGNTFKTDDAYLAAFDKFIHG